MRRASPAPSLGRKKQPRKALPRGKPPRSRPFAARGGTPARAWKGQGTRWSRSWHTDSPRPCGECLLGPPFSVPRSDHPRIRGEKVPCPQTETCRCGAPPRMRGTVLLCVIPVGMPPHGSPPCLRGKSRTGRCISSFRWDHPRVCGEKPPFCTRARKSRGSPPPVRGKGIFDIVQSVDVRITPACAGKSRVAQPNVVTHPDHPRLCGEKGMYRCICTSKSGSPPRVRRKAP